MPFPHNLPNADHFPSMRYSGNPRSSEIDFNGSVFDEARLWQSDQGSPRCRQHSDDHCFSCHARRFPASRDQRQDYCPLSEHYSPHSFGKARSGRRPRFVDPWPMFEFVNLGRMHPENQDTSTSQQHTGEADPSYADQSRNISDELPHRHKASTFGSYCHERRGRSRHRFERGSSLPSDRCWTLSPDSAPKLTPPPSSPVSPFPRPQCASSRQNSNSPTTALPRRASSPGLPGYGESADGNKAFPRRTSLRPQVPFCSCDQEEENAYRLYRKMNRKATRLLRLQERLERTAEALQVREARLQQLESRLYGEVSQGIHFGTGGAYQY